MTQTHLFIYFFVTFPDQSQSLLQKAKKLYLVEELGLTGGRLVDKDLQAPPRLAGLAVPLSLGPLLKS